MKSFPQKSWTKSYGQSSGKKLTQNKEGFLLRSRFADGTLIKFPRLLPWNRKSSPLCRTLRLTRKSILIKKKKRNKKRKMVQLRIFSGKRNFSSALANVNDSGTGS